ncbi:hypothetical protein SAMN04487766_10322 [Actinomyces ruminicola]|uniref:Uncharacterized protein n=2 Tax=Actinomyces ruminicola TaxID=332524 RepID=A0A1G9TJJ2_9ACTO|nr:hypothetical protein SAMN04487766_10322 [Actinomyces ruminicola]
MPWWLALLNSVMGAVSVIAAAAALLRPGLLVPSGTGTDVDRDRFYPAMYAARAVPLGVVVAVIVWLTPLCPLTQLVLAMAALAQLGDVAIGVARRQPGMAGGAAVAAAIHLAGLVALR